MKNWSTYERIAWFDPDKLRIDGITVETETLDSLDLLPAIVKIDVQGAEEMVVEGGLETFERCLPATVMECPTEKIVNHISRFGLQAYHYYKGRLKGWKSHTYNLIFPTDTHHRQLAL